VRLLQKAPLEEPRLFPANRSGGRLKLKHRAQALGAHRLARADIAFDYGGKYLLLPAAQNHRFHPPFALQCRLFCFLALATFEC
jgi:hypothetical protein